jgi:oxygen-independent coproporphyrinogen III oxidase
MDHARNSPVGAGLTRDSGGASIQHLYAHIPFCPVKCDYCAFVTHIGSDKLIERYVAAVQSEAIRHVAAGHLGPLETIYLGGGTPSMLTPLQVSDLLSAFRTRFGSAPSAEVTIEAHPHTIDAQKLIGYLKAGVNRISFGIESLVPEELGALGRFEADKFPAAALYKARRAGFVNIAADLMYGIPLQTSDSWARTLQQLLEFEPDHLSLYPLSIEPKTVLERRRQRHGLVLPDDDHVVEMYEVACEVLSLAGYQHYEVGSWCRDGRQSRHNVAYWHNREYFGLGVGAHGYVRGERTVNVRQTMRYIRRLEAGDDPTEESEAIDSDTRRVETIMLRLRLLSEGLEIDHVKQYHHWDMRQRCHEELRLLSDAGLISVEHGRIFLLESAVPVANDVWERLAI